MPDYAKMYRHLWGAQADAIALLQKAHQATEEMYISSPDPDIRLLDSGNQNIKQEEDNE